MATTSTVEGPFLFFQRTYFLLALATVVEHIRRSVGKKLRTYVQQAYGREIIIRNTVGTFSVNAKNDSFTKALASFEYKHQRWLDEALEREIFLDIGANIGFYSILAVKKYGFQKVHAFEPNPESYERLEKNIQLNNLADKVSLHSIGMGNTKGRAILTAKRVHVGASTLVKNKAPRGSADLVEVSLDTFDNISRDAGIKAEDVSFIKIDVEGYEYQVLTGMEKTLKNLKTGTCLFIEIHPAAPRAAETKHMITDAEFTFVTSSPQKNFLYKKVSNHSRHA